MGYFFRFHMVNDKAACDTFYGGDKEKGVCASNKMLNCRHSG